MLRINFLVYTGISLRHCSFNLEVFFHVLTSNGDFEWECFLTQKRCSGQKSSFLSYFHHVNSLTRCSFVVWRITSLYMSLLTSWLIYHTKKTELPFWYKNYFPKLFYNFLHFDNTPKINFLPVWGMENCRRITLLVSC